MTIENTVKLYTVQEALPSDCSQIPVHAMFYDNNSLNYLLIHGFLFSICQLIQIAPQYLLIYKINAYLLCCSIRYSVRMNLAKPVRNMNSTHAASTRLSHYSVIGALVGTLTGLGLVFNKQKVHQSFVKKRSIFA